MKALLTSGLILCYAFAYSQQTYYDVTAGNGYGIRFWQSDNYKIHMGNTAEYLYGPVTDYSIKMNSNGTPGRGWTWGNAGVAPIAAISNSGDMQIAGSFATGGHIHLPSESGNKWIYTWSPGDMNWRIGMSPAPGFTRSLATSHVQYLTYFNGPGQGFAVGVNNGQSSLEITGNNHQAYFRGNIGVGTVSPYSSSRLHVKATVDTPWNLISESSSNGRIIGLSHDGTQGIVAVSYLGNNGFSPLQFRTSNLARLTIDVGGNVGIGTASPNERLTVSGTIYGKEVKVDLSVPAPDYVFEKNYDLSSIAEVKAYINANKHLPGVPSAKEMAVDGIRLGEMDMILLKKVEELTLYIIELEQENTILREEFLNKLEELESKISVRK